MKLKLLSLVVFSILSTTALAQPTIPSQPTDQTANQGYSASFVLRAIGTAPLSYTWFFNQSLITGAMTNKLTITNAQPANAGDYFAIVSDSTGSVTSRVVKLTVVARAILDPKIGPNVMIGEARTNPPSATRSQW